MPAYPGFPGKRPLNGRSSAQYTNNRHKLNCYFSLRPQLQRCSFQSETLSLQLFICVPGLTIFSRWRWALVGPDGVAPSRMVSMSASVNLSLHHKVQKLSFGTGSPGWSRKRAVKLLWYGVVVPIHLAPSFLCLTFGFCCPLCTVVNCIGSRPSDHYFRSVCLSVCLFVCLCRVFLSRLRSSFDQTRTCVTCPGLVVSPRI